MRKLGEPALEAHEEPAFQTPTAPVRILGVGARIRIRLQELAAG